MNKKIVLLVVWILIVLVGPITVLVNTSISSVAVNRLILTNFFQRIFGLTAFTLFFIQIILGAFMEKWIERFGAWIFRFHVIEGVVLYSLILAHTTSFIVFNYFARNVFDPFYVFVDLCLLCQGKLEWFYNFGRIAFWLASAAIFTAFFRTHPALRVHWRKFHLLNYFAFFLISLHAWKLGTNVNLLPFSWFFWIANFGVLVTLLGKIRFKNFNLLKKNP